MEKIFLIGASGSILLHISRYHTKIKYAASQTGSKFLILAFIWGILPFSVLTLCKDLFYHLTLPWRAALEKKELIFTLKTALLALCTFILGCLFATYKMRNSLA